jgi:hypothetical protein
MSTEGPQAYRVIWTESARKDASQLADAAIAEGGNAAADLLFSLRKIIEALSWIPVEWGEPYQELFAMKVKVCIGFRENLSVRYGVDEERRLVYVRQIRQM